MKLGIVRLYMGESGKIGYYNIQELGLAKALFKKGIETDIFFLNKSENKEVIIHNISNGIRIIYIPALKLGNHGIINPKFILEYKLDIVHLLSDNQLMVPTFIKFCNKNNIPIYNYIGTIYSDTNNRIKKAIMNFLVKRNIKCFKESITIAKTVEVKKVLESKGIEKVELIPVGLDLDLIPEITQSKEQLRQQLRLPINKKILIFVGRLEQYKNPIKALEILIELNRKSDDYYLVIIGEGSLEEKIVKKIEKYNLNNIQMIKKMENKNIHKYYKACDIYLNFNNKEIFGMSILEAMYQECIVIAVEAPGPKFIIDNNKDGIVIKDFNYNTWIKKIQNVSKDNKIIFSSRNKILNFFNWNIIVELYLQLFEKI